MHTNGKVISQLVIKHDYKDFCAVKQKIAALEPHPKNVSVAIEKHNGSLLDWLLDSGYAVYSINPKSTHRARAIFRPTGAKDDPGDARMIADLLRNNTDCFHLIQNPSKQTKSLLSLTRLRKKVVQQKTPLMERLRVILSDKRPDLSKLCNDFNRDWQLDLLALLFSDQRLINADHLSLQSFFSSHRLSKATKQKIELVLNQTPSLINQDFDDSLFIEIPFLITMIRYHKQTLDQVEEKIATAFSQHSCHPTFKTLPVKGVATQASLTALFGDPHPSAVGWRQLAARWGLAPVTYASGKSISVRRRRACDHFALQIFSDLAFTSIFSIKGCWSSDFYQRKRKEGHAHHQALRAVGLRWVKIIWRIWKDGTAYDEDFHRKKMKSGTLMPLSG
jgi:hypothetical protein